MTLTNSMAPWRKRSAIAIAIAIAVVGVVSFWMMLGTSVMSALAQAADYPSRQIQVVVPFPAGGSADYFARGIFNRLGPAVGHPIVIENKAGAGGMIGAKAVINAPPDGYTLLVSAVASVLVPPNLSTPPAFDPLKDLTAITGIGTVPAVLVVKPALGIKTFAELLAYAKANPGKINFGYGQGTTPHLVGGLFQQETGIQLSFIPYKGGAQAVADMLGGHIHMNIGTSATLRPLARDGKLRALAVTGKTRMPELPEVPTMVEGGYPNVTSAIYYGLLGPAGLPAEIVKRINDGANASLKSPELIARMAQLGFEPQGGSPQDFGQLFVVEREKWLPIVKATGFQME